MIGCLPSLLSGKRNKMTIETGVRGEEQRCARDRFKVVECRARVDSKPTEIRESSSTLNYVTPHFRACAEIELDAMKDGEIFTVGWVQAVTSMKFYNTYPKGQSSWEIQELNSGDSVAVSDADGRQYPWYGVTSECRTVRGPSDVFRVKVTMNDNFSPTVSWAIPVGREQPDTLTAVHRDQSFLVWLVAKNEVSGDVFALRAFRWQALVNIAVDCECEVGNRAKLLEPVYQEQPKAMIGHELAIPQSALLAPRANEAQKFVWRTSNSELIFEVTCTPAVPPAVHQPLVGEARYPMRYAPY
jgi:hypothetical protein